MEVNVSKDPMMWASCVVGWQADVLMVGFCIRSGQELVSRLCMRFLSLRTTTTPVPVGLSVGISQLATSILSVFRAALTE